MNDHHHVYGRLRPAIAVLLLLFLAACGAQDGDLSPPALAYSGSLPETTVRERYLAGTVAPDANFEIFVAGEAETADLAVRDGRWACRVTGLEDGNNFVTVTAEDSAGNQRSINFTLAYDALNFTTYRSPVPGTALEVGGLVDPAAAATLTVTVGEGAAVDALTVTGDAWTALVSGLTEGRNEITASIVHPELGEVAKTLTIGVNEEAPLVTIDPVASPTDSDQQTIAGSRGEGLDVVVQATTAEVGNIDLAADPTRWSVPLASLTPGKNPVTASISDAGITATARGLIRHHPGTLVVDREPAADATGVDPATAVEAVFGVPMDPATITAASFSLTGPDGPVAGTVSYDPELRTAVLEPGALNPGAVYTATLSTTVATVAGAPLPDQVSWSFTVR